MNASEPRVGYPELAKSMLVLYDMAAFYLPLHAIEPRRYFEFLPVLSIVEGLIYQVELAIESTDETAGADVWPDQAIRIARFLADKGCDGPAVKTTLDEVGRYFGLAARLRSPGPHSPDDIREAAEARPADIRLLHAVLLRLIDAPDDPALFDLLWPVEVLMDIKANLTEYADDVASGHHNTYHLLVGSRGADARSIMADWHARYTAEAERRLAAAAPADRLRVRQFITRHEADYPSVPVPAPALDAVRSTDGAGL